jgi:kynurenine 3-monooxygenase
MCVQSEKIAILGAGLVGSVLAMYLARRGYQVDVFERHSDLRQLGAVGHRSSISMTLCDRGLHVLDDIGVGDAIRELTVPVYGRRIHTLTDLGPFQPYGNKGEALYAISRNDMNQALLIHAEKYPNIHFHYNEKCIDVDLPSTTITFENTKTGSTTRYQPDRLFAADGAYSIVRRHMQRLDRFNYSQRYLDYGYRELTIPATASGEAIFDRNELHLWPRNSYLLLGFANRDNSITVSLFLPFIGPTSFASLRTTDDIRQFFEDSFPDALPYMPDLEKEYFAKVPNSMVTIQCSPWSYGDRITLIGDAAHAIVPYYGQGANAGFEDCMIFNRCLERHGDDWAAVFANFEALRKPNTDLIGQLAADHFVELNARVNDPRFLLRKQIERKVNRMYPNAYTPFYSMIAFSSRPYIEAMQVEQRQRVIIDRVMDLEHIEARWDSFEVEQIIHQLIRDAGTGMLVEEPVF